MAVVIAMVRVSTVNNNNKNNSIKCSNYAVKHTVSMQGSRFNKLHMSSLPPMAGAQMVSLKF